VGRPKPTFIYQADLLCETCGNAKREELKAAGKAPANPSDERSYDSDDYPKGPVDGGGEADSYSHCAGCGVFLRNYLTKAGVDYGIEQLREYVKGDGGHGETLDEWAEDLSDYSQVRMNKEDWFVLTVFKRLRTVEKQLARWKADAVQAAIDRDLRD
jgi:hypothetical protein